MRKLSKNIYFILSCLFLAVACKSGNTQISSEEINAIQLKRGEIVLCGPANKQFGSVSFDITCSRKEKDNFNLAIALLHSFEYEEAEKMFAKIISAQPDCAMAYWGVAMCNFHPLWAPPSGDELEKGNKAIQIARKLGGGSERESDFIDAIALFYHDGNIVDHHTRCVRYEKAMEKIFQKYPNDREAAIFYALSLDASASPTDKSFANQIRAGEILNKIYPDEPNHPGIVHYIIHTYDYPGLAEKGLHAAREYASVAPASAHALHMPSHIFTRLGIWDESIQSNLASVSAAKCYAENNPKEAHRDEELHGMDYLVYAYLQKAEDSLAKAQWNYMNTIKDASLPDFKVAYAFAAIPARYVLEKRLWKEAAQLPIYPVSYPWEKFPWEKAIVYFARTMGNIQIGNLDSATTNLENLKKLRDTLLGEKDAYKANQVNIQIIAARSWLLFRKKETAKALEQMTLAADMEDATEKHPVTPGEVIPARELLGDMLLKTGRYRDALTVYESDLKRHPKRFNGLYGAGYAAEKSGDSRKAKSYYQQLSDICIAGGTRPELIAAREYLKKSKT
jgi:tetratricopeptide (TPR) repeat protein